MNMEQKERKIWIDWFKVIGMFFIIWGHLFPYYFTDFVYSFSVPAFFWASGYLSKTGKNNRQFFDKLWKSLCVPYLLICIINCVLCIVVFHSHYLTVNGVLRSLIAIPLGIQSYADNTAVGIGPMWFVYTLIVIKCIHHFSNKTILIGLSVISLLAISFFITDHVTIAAAVTIICLPFYTIGLCCQDLNKRNLTIYKSVPILAIVLMLTVVLYVLAGMNHAPYLFKLEYGEDVFLMLLNAIIGIVILYLISKIFQRIGGGNSYKLLMQGW